jgi:hypothetical protein
MGLPSVQDKNEIPLKKWAVDRKILINVNVFVSM